MRNSSADGGAAVVAARSNAVGAAESASRLSPELSRLALLLALSIFINYIDRGNLAIAAPHIKDELGLTYSHVGILVASFFWTYAIFQIVSGWLVDRLPVNWVLALGILLWSAATVATGLVNGFKLLLAVRLILGIGESVAYPSYSKIISRNFSEFQRGRANSLISAGQALGPAFGTLLGGMLMARVGWRLFFIVLGIASSLWLLPWIKFIRTARSHEAKPTPESLNARAMVSRESAAQDTVESPAGCATILQILRQRSAWGTFAGLFAYNYIWYFFITWCPSYLVLECHFSVQGMSIVSGLAFLVLAVSALVSGCVSDKWIAAGGTPTLVRKTFPAPSPTIHSLILLVGIVANN